MSAICTYAKLPMHTVFGYTTSGLFQLVSAYSPSQNTIESSKIIQNPLFNRSAERAGRQGSAPSRACSGIWKIFNMKSVGVANIDYGIICDSI